MIWKKWFLSQKVRHMALDKIFHRARGKGAYKRKAFIRPYIRHLWRSFLIKTVNNLKPSATFPKKLYHSCLMGF